jgi:hypothetical protein
VTTLVVITDGVISLHADPLGDGAVLAHLLAQGELQAEFLVRRLSFNRNRSKQGELSAFSFLLLFTTFIQI